MTHTLHAHLTKAGVRKLLHELSGITALSYPEIAKRSSVHFTSIYHILREQPGDNKKQVRPSTVRKIAESLGFQARIDTHRNEITLRQSGGPPNAHQRDPLDKLAREIAEWLRAIGKTHLTPVEKKKVREMLRILLK